MAEQHGSQPATQKRQNKHNQLQCPHCDKTFTALSGLASHVHFLHPDKPLLDGRDEQPRPQRKGAQATARAGVRVKTKVKKVTCPQCQQTFASPHRLATHLQYRHADKSSATTAIPTAAAHVSASAPAPVVATNASVQEHLKTALQDLTKRRGDIDVQLSRIESLQSEKGAITKQIDAVNAALHAFEV